MFPSPMQHIGYSAKDHCKSMKLIREKEIYRKKKMKMIVLIYNLKKRHTISGIKSIFAIRISTKSPSIYIPKEIINMQI